ncbi:MAG: exodeoxyribonuclease VII large subunit [Clostridia bacterium]|nr:exodeoxyribonuclease VII large subunit [Clostridia bacterium]
MSTVLKVSQINTYLKSIIDEDINLKNIYITGEISNFTNHYRTGHLYFTLKDEKSAIKAVMFRTSASRLRFEPENGMKVLIRGSISVFERDGTYQIYCDDMIPEGVGELTIAFEQLKEKLSKEGLFDDAHKKELPQYPSRIGVITSPTGAALQDILTVLSRRYPSGEIVFEGVQVQGDSAAPQIAGAIRKFNELGGADVLIVGRGGGSIEDLWAFNEEIVARAIYESEIPIVSAVGHETDFTIADFVSDMRAPTPSAAAEIVAPDYREILYAADKTLDGMIDAIEKKIYRYRMNLMAAQKIISDRGPHRMIEFYGTCLEACETKINSELKRKVDFYENALMHYTSKLEATSPLKVLARGYSVVFDENMMTVRSAETLKANDRIKIRLSDGSVDCTVN